MFCVITLAGLVYEEGLNVPFMTSAIMENSLSAKNPDIYIIVCNKSQIKNTSKFFPETRHLYKM